MTLQKQLRKARFMRWRNKLDGVLDRREAIYATMFNDAVRASYPQAPGFFPTAGAANYSLLYLLLRCLTELPVSRSLELGMGQTTLLHDAVGANAVSLDHEEEWAKRMGAKVKHRCLYAPQQTLTVHGHEVPVYTADLGGEGFDLVLVDGPQGTPRYSRWGALELLDRHLGEEFLVIFDDAERRGEQDLVLEFVKDRAVGTHLILGSKAQLVAYTPKFSAVQYF